MMKPTFEDVLEFVRAGEEDVQMAKNLRLHPDGPELLKQARFICKVLQLKSESTDDDFLPGRPDESLGEHIVAESREIMRDAPSSRTYGPAAYISPSFSKSVSIDRMVEDQGRRSEDLGTLELAVEGKQVTLSYKPSKTAMDRSGKPYLLKYHAAQMDFEGIQIRGNQITVSMPQSSSSGDPLPIRLTRSLKQMPARNLELIFMPDSGPFVRIKTDVKGLATLPVPDQPGTLRIGNARPQLLHIKIKK